MCPCSDSSTHSGAQVQGCRFYDRARDNGQPDPIAAVQQLADRDPWIDAGRVGVWGHSGGGNAAAAAMRHYPDFFSVGVAQSGNHDFRIHGWYSGEKYQGLYRQDESGDNFEDQAKYKYAANLQGKLLMMTGDMDCNNPPAETLRVMDSLIQADSTQRSEPGAISIRGTIDASHRAN